MTATSHNQMNERLLQRPTYFYGLNDIQMFLLLVVVCRSVPEPLHRGGHCCVAELSTQWFQGTG